MGQQEDFVEYYTIQYCHHKIDNSDLSKHLATEHMDDIFTRFIKPTFPGYNQDLLLQRRQAQRKQTHNNIDNDLLEHKWKTVKDGFDTVGVMEWIVDTCSANELETVLPKLTPLVLRVLDDFDVGYKTRAVIMVHSMISSLDIEVITRFGLDNVFIDALFKCLNYLSDTRDLSLLNAAYSCLTDVIGKSKPAGSKERYRLYERMMTDGVVPGLTYAGDKSPFLLVLLKAIDTLALELGTLLVRYLKLVIFGISNGLCNANKDVNQIALDTLKHVIQKTSPRIPAYGGVILRALVTLWLNHCDNQDDASSQTICKKTKAMYQLLCYVCQGQLKPDTQALLDFDRSSLEGLLV
ncbi:hypothetical protein BC941DRAFT_411659 [Chlamydoabsidia padenii]|nr:hypothetical protein BC941DRAFT_411659 [Chlamydoabsidia padenii]